MRTRLPRLVILLTLWLAILTACRPAEPEEKIATDLNELSLMSLWTTVVEETAVRPETAILESFRFSTSAGGSLERLHLVFHALNEEGRNEAIFVDAGEQGDLTWRRRVVERADYPLHPETVMAALDEAALAEVAAERGGLTLLADTIAGNISYRQEHVDVYVLADGQRRPVREIVFRSDTPWTTITVCAPAVDEGREGAEREGGVVVTRTVTAGDDGQCEIWFLEETSAKADVLELEGAVEELEDG